MALMTPNVSQWLASWAAPLPLAEVIQRIELANSDADVMSLVIETRQPSQTIGWIRLGRTGPASRTGELSYWLGEAYQGRGYGTEAARAMLSSAWTVLDLDQIEAGAQLDNLASLGLMQRLGMTLLEERTFFAPARQRQELCRYYVTHRPR